MPRKHSFRQRPSSARVPPVCRARRGDRSHGVSVASRALARISLQALRQRPSAGLPQDQAKTTLRKAQDSNPSHGPGRLMGLGPKPHRVSQNRPSRNARPGPGKGRGRVNSAGPEPHPGVTSPWPSHLRVVLGYAGVHPLLSPGQSGSVARQDHTAA